MPLRPEGPPWKARILPIGVDVAVEPAQSLLAAARRAGLRWPAPCRGVGVCTQCMVQIIEGDDHLVPADAYEAERLAAKRARSRERLACRVRLTGPVTVQKLGVQRA